MHQVVPVILCGGSGTRLWPLSRTGFPKQFLCLTGSESLFQQAAQRLVGLGNTDIQVTAPLIVTGEGHRFLASEQLREIGIELGSALLEPVGRNTAPALTLAALAAVEGGKDPILVVTPADQTVTNPAAFTAAMQSAVQEAATGRQVLQPVQTAQALKEIEGTRLQTHTISRVPNATECVINPAPAPAAPETITLAADALFAFGRSDLAAISPPGRASLDALIARLRDEYIQLDRLHIVGHADPLGQPGPNARLATERAQTVQKYLTQSGLNYARMTSEGRGDREPVATQCGLVTTPQAIACHAPNRRVVIDIAGARR